MLSTHLAIPTAATATALALTTGLLAQDASPTDTPRFGAPVRLHAGDALLGAGRLYPSPAVHDVDRDGELDVVLGDLTGRVTFARRIARDDGTFALAGEDRVLGADGKPVDFNNW
jgi:hypothetical protein